MRRCAEPSVAKGRPVKSAPANRQHRWLRVALLGIAFAGTQGLAAWRDRHAVLVNMSDSLPTWAFFLERDRAPKSGDAVFFEPRPSALLAAHFGPEPQLFGKRVLGVPGETVRHYERLVTVNHRVVGWTKPATRKGLPLVRSGDGVIPPGCFYVGSDHPDGFDSRYAAIGPVCQRPILGVGTAIL